MTYTSIYTFTFQKKSHRFVLDSVTDRQLSEDDPDPPPLYSELSVESGEDFADNASVSSMSSAGSKTSYRSQFSRQASHASWPDLCQVITILFLFLKFFYHSTMHLRWMFFQTLSLSVIISFLTFYLLSCYLLDGFL